MFILVGAENIFFPPEFSNYKFYKPDQGAFDLPIDEFLHDNIRNSIGPHLIVEKHRSI